MDSMIVRIQMFSNFLKYLPQNTGLTAWDVPLSEGTSIRDLLIHIKIPLDSPMVITVNDTNMTSEYTIQDKDVIKIFPVAMGG